MVGTSNLGSWNGQWKNKTCGPCVKNLLISKGKGCGYFNNTMAPIWVVFIFDASMVFSYLRYLIFFCIISTWSLFQSMNLVSPNEETKQLGHFFDIKLPFQNMCIYIYNNSPVPNSRISPFIPTQLPSFRDPNPPSSNKEIPGEGFRDHKAPVASKTPRL